MNERKLNEVNEKNERSLSEVLSGVLKQNDFCKVEKIIKFIEKKGEITPKEADGNTNNSVYKINDCMSEKIRRCE